MVHPKPVQQLIEAWYAKHPNHMLKIEHGSLDLLEAVRLAFDAYNITKSTQQVNKIIQARLEAMRGAMKKRGSTKVGDATRNEQGRRAEKNKVSNKVSNVRRALL